MSEAILSDLAASDPDWKTCALRYFNSVGCDASGMLGEDPRGSPNNLMPLVIRVTEGKMRELSVFGSDWDTEDGTAIRDFIHISNLTRGHVAAIVTGLDTKSACGFHSINLGTGNGSSAREVVDTMQAVSAKEIKTKSSGRRRAMWGPGMSPRITIAVAKIE
ncbi:NAD(P)-binding protein [Didymella exigua CBS 183.55]|uniref:NAD(P)-binding protein n=1 Tax=Didymella exigua CBS 183.55 TaxID=1150837 RepID=A0A6A5RZE9_9PLEO|nr:NAD(P)-binding protein [Didymella exigua CBS 183.55]KAF1932983.1 NAD(P)-binding protein [Didymella exigua CBS 183.55]